MHKDYLLATTSSKTSLFERDIHGETVRAWQERTRRRGAQARKQSSLPRVGVRKL